MSKKICRVSRVIDTCSACFYHTLIPYNRICDCRFGDDRVDLTYFDTLRAIPEWCPLQDFDELDKEESE
jgi:hypothetical protein